MAPFEKEKGRVILLMQRLGHAPDEYRDPNAGAGESGADVVVVFGNRRIGIQVTDLDTGDEPGAARRGEAGLARDAAARNSTYLTWGQNDPAKMVVSVGRSVARKARMSFAGYLGVEEQALYEWHRGSGWSKSTVELPPAQQAPDFWDYKDDPELLRDPEGWCAREVKRALAELRGTR